MGVTARLAACSAATFLALTLHATGVSAAPARTELAFAAGQMPLSPFASRHSGASCLQMATKTKTKSKARTSAKTSNGGFGKKTESPVSSGVDVAALLRASTDAYNDMLDAYNAGDNPADQELREYIVTVRAVGAKGSEAQMLRDWVPAALLGIHWRTPLDDNPLLQGMADPNLGAPLGIKAMRREIFESICQNAPSLRKVPREALAFGFEPLDIFTGILEEVNGATTSSVDAWKVLGLDKGADAGTIKAAHRKLVRELHPDMTAQLPEDEQAAARARFTQVQEAYERLGGGVGDDGGSWYERLGGKGRADFFRPVDVKKEMNMELAGHWRMHVQPLDPDMTNTFLTRNAMRQA